jgi:DNA-binding transcriptional regulator GbsR (MarR family)
MKRFKKASSKMIRTMRAFKPSSEANQKINEKLVNENKQIKSELKRMRKMTEDIEKSKPALINFFRDMIKYLRYHNVRIVLRTIRKTLKKN